MSEAFVDTEILTDKCAIVFVNYNTSDQIIEAIRSLANEPVGKIVVVDNASPLDKPEIIKDAFPAVELIKLAHNVGFGEGCNVGAKWALQHTDLPYIFFLNPDTRVEPGCVDQLIRRFTDPGVGAVVPRITTMGETPTLWYGGGYMNWWKGSATVPGYAGPVDSELALLERDVEFASGCALLLRREVLVRCGGFDSRYFMYEEDVELSLRLGKHGLRIRYVPSAIVRHVAQGSHEESARSIGMYDALNPRLTFFIYYVIRNRCITVLCNGNPLERTKFFFGFSAWLLKKSVRWLNGGRYDAFGAVYRGLRDVRGLLRNT
jgi:GT2 family glycosyltransferase